MHKPEFLYHASQNTNISLFEPKIESIRHPDEGPVVFAGEDKNALTVFIVPTTSDWVELGTFTSDHEKIQYALISDMGRFKMADKGGAIYKLPSNTFSIDKRYDKKGEEWTSTVPVKPISKEIYPSGLGAMIEAGVQVYFVDMEIFKEIKNSNDNGYNIIKNLTSENNKEN